VKAIILSVKQDCQVQEANMTFPSDVSLLVKLGGLAKKVISYIVSKIPKPKDIVVTVNFKEIKAKTRTHLFSSKRPTEEREKYFQGRYLTVVEEAGKVYLINLTAV